MRTKELHSYLLGMSQLCYYYTNPHSFLFLFFFLLVFSMKLRHEEKKYSTLYAICDIKCWMTMYGKAYGKALKLFTIL